MIVSNGDCHIPQRLAAGLNADGAAHISGFSNSSSSSKVGTGGTAPSCKLRDPLPLPLIPRPSSSSGHVCDLWDSSALGCCCSASSNSKPRCRLMASNHSQPSIISNSRCGCSWNWSGDDAPAASDGQFRARSRYADRSLVTGSRTTPILIQPLLFFL